MSDEKLRELERRWKGTGAVEDEAAFLLERVRAGELTQERLELAAYCGHQAATAAMAHQPFSGTLEDWVRGLAGFGFAPVDQLAARVAVAVADSVQGGWERRGDDGDDTPQQAIDATRAWIDCPCSNHLRAAERTAEIAHETGEDRGYESFQAGPGAGPVSQPAHVAGDCAEVPGNWTNLINVIRSAAIALGQTEDPVDVVPEQIQQIIGVVVGTWSLDTAEARG